jgi:hypothetical protein
LQRFTGGQTELDPPAEEQAGGDAVAAATLRHGNSGFSTSCTIARFCSSLKRRRFDRPFASCGVKRYSQRAQLAALLICARASDEAGDASPFRCRIVPGDRVKYAASAVRDQRYGMLGKSHSDEVHRFDMHAPERLKRNRAVVRVHAVTIAPRPPFGASTAFSSAAVSALSWGQIPQMFCTFAQIVRAQQMARPPHRTCRRKIVLPAVVLRFQRLDTKPQHASTETGCWPLPRNGAVPSEILQCCRRTRELEMK